MDTTLESLMLLVTQCSPFFFCFFWQHLYFYETTASYKTHTDNYILIHQMGELNAYVF